MDGENGVLAAPVDAVMEMLRARAGRGGAGKIVEFGGGEGELGQVAAPPRKVRGGARAVDGQNGVESCSGGNTGPPPDLSVIGRLRRRFGLGDDPKRRMLLYQRLQVLVDRHGEPVLQLISEAAAGAVGKNNKAGGEGRWFSKAICAKLAEAGITVGSTKGVSDGPCW